jgi:tRNA uridine 5-carboxymethylaminomethyl modification enzyme
MGSSISCDIVVVGGGHAGCEAALAAARMGADTVLLTADPDRIAQMSCNPAIGGLAKGQLVREIDALGGEMARVTDRTGIQFRMLNKGKGPAVWSPRAQSDREHYRREMTASVMSQRGLRVAVGSAVEVVAEGGAIAGVVTSAGDRIEAQSVVLTPGTFLNGVMHVGFETSRGGRHGEEASTGLTESLQRLGLTCGRLKTGTSPRVRAGSVDFAAMERQDGDDPPRPFSHFTGPLRLEQMPCHVSRSNALTADAVRRNIERSPLYSGRIRGVGPRYCPSFEDKVMRFPDRPSHQIIVEPEGRQADLVYLNGLSTSLPADVQLVMVRSLDGLREAEIVVPGYAVEYDFVFPTQLEPSLECKTCKGLFLAGQINGTSGYEEAAAQGLVAGVNAIRRLEGAPALVLGRHEAYIGVLIDDLVTKGTREPYRMFTSMAEYRLLLRQDNADERLARYGWELGLLSEEDYRSVRERHAAVASELGRLRSAQAIAPPPPRPAGAGADSGSVSPPLSRGSKITLETLLSRPHITYDDLAEVDPASSQVPQWLRELVQIRVKYAGYIRRQERDIERFKRLEGMLIPVDLWEERLVGLSVEAGEKLREMRPRSLGQAGRIPGVTPADVSVLHLHLERRLRSGGAAAAGSTRKGPRRTGDTSDDAK